LLSSIAYFMGQNKYSLKLRAIDHYKKK